MHFYAGDVYHLHNCGNNDQPIFFQDANYEFFLRKLGRELLPHCDLLAYCLLPKQFDLILTPNPCGTSLISAFGDNGESGMQLLSATVGKLLSSYARAINKERDATGSLFRQKTNAYYCCAMPGQSGETSPEQIALVDRISRIHHQPAHQNLSSDPEAWAWSSAKAVAELGFWHSLTLDTVTMPKLARSFPLPKAV